MGHYLFDCFILFLGMEIIYKKGIRNGYAKIENGGIKLIIPYIARNDQKFLEKIQLL